LIRDQIQERGSTTTLNLSKANLADFHASIWVIEVHAHLGQMFFFVLLLAVASSLRQAWLNVSKVVLVQTV
jgi:hypothetical protein